MIIQCVRRHFYSDSGCWVKLLRFVFWCCETYGHEIVNSRILVVVNCSGPLFKKAVADSNAPCQEKALDALIAYLRAADTDAARRVFLSPTFQDFRQSRDQKTFFYFMHTKWSRFFCDWYLIYSVIAWEGSYVFSLRLRVVLLSIASLCMHLILVTMSLQPDSTQHFFKSVVAN